MYRFTALLVLFLILNYGWTVSSAGEPVAHGQCMQFEYDRKLLERLLVTEMRVNPCCDKVDGLDAEIARLKGEIAELKSSSVVAAPVESEGWRLVFRVTAGNGVSVFNAWKEGVDVTTTKPTDMKRSNGRHFRDPIVGIWPGATISRVKYSLFWNQAEVAYVIFDGRGSNRDSWFDRSKLLISSWTDVTPAAPYNYFSIAGDSPKVLRRFFINQLYKGCPGDIGYTGIIDVNAPNVCNMDRHAVYPQIIYSQINGPELWDLGNYGRADYSAVYIEYV